MKLSRLFASRRFQLLGALAAILVVGGVTYGSGASFTSASANAENTFVSGDLTMSNDQSGAIMTGSRMVPAEVKQGTVTIRNAGDVAGQFYLEPVTLTNITKKFDAKLQLEITDETGATIYVGPLNGLGPDRIDLKLWQPGVKHSYTFTLTFPDTGEGMDNDYKGATVDAQFDWIAISMPDATE